MTKCSKIIGTIKTLSLNVPHVLLRIYKSFTRSQFDYQVEIYEKPNNQSFKNKIGDIRYTACIVITSAVQGTSRKRLSQELDLESLENLCWYQNLIFFS